MLERILVILGLGALLLGTAPAQAQQANNYWCNSATVPCPPSGWTPASSANPFPVTGSFTPSGTQTTASVGTAALATGQASVTTGNISIVAARTGAVGTGRKTVCITNITGTGPLYIGNTGLTTSNGMYIPGVAGASICLDTQAAVFGTVTSVTQVVSYTETF